MLTPKQQKQISQQIKAYEDIKTTRAVTVTLGKETFCLDIAPCVASPDIMNSGPQMVNYLVEHPDLVKEKIVIDMGTGSGILGISAAKLGAKTVFMSDVDENAVKNAQKNIFNLHLENICEAFKSNLFDKYGDRPKANVLIFNHPFFSSEPIEGKDWTRMMLGGTSLLGKYFEEAPKHSEPDAIYLMPWLTLADNEGTLDNDPGKRATAYGFKVIRVTEQTPVKRGLQQNKFKIYELQKEK